MRILQNTNIDFMGKRKMWYMISLLSLVIGLISIPLKGGLHYGLDFTGGTELIVQFSQPPDIGQLRGIMDKAGFQKSEIKTYGELTRVSIRTEAQGENTIVGDRIKAALQESLPQLNPQTIEEQKIGPKVGAELRAGAFMAVVWSILAMLVYIGFRFKFIYGVGAVVALIHDVIFTLGVISITDGLTPLTQFEFDQNMIAAFLTLVGLSVNDTVVIFDRIRENQKIYRSMSLADVMNKSLNQTLSRTIITSGLVFLVTSILFLFGGEVNRGFAFAMTIGIVTGTYSSIYIASAIVLDFNNYRLKRKNAPVPTTKMVYETLDQRS